MEPAWMRTCACNDGESQKGREWVRAACENARTQLVEWWQHRRVCACLRARAARARARWPVGRGAVREVEACARSFPERMPVVGVRSTI